MGRFTDALGLFTDFLDVFNKDPLSGAANFVTLLSTAYTVATEIYAYANGQGGFSPPPEDDTSAQLENIQISLQELDKSLVDIEENLTDLITDQFTGLRQQQLASAVSRAQSAVDLLNLTVVSDRVAVSEIIADASRALRDTLAQSIEMVTPTSEYQPSLSSFGTAVNAVVYTLGVRIKVAAMLEANELASTGIRDQILDASNFLDQIIPTLRAELDLRSATTTPRNNGGEWFEVQINIDDTDFRDSYDVNFQGNDQLISPRPNATTIRAEVNSSNEVTWRGDVYNIGIGAQRDELTERMLEFLQDAALSFLGIEPDPTKAGSLLNTIAGFREDADGGQFVLPSRAGFPNDGTLVGTAGNDLIIGNDGNDVLSGLGDPDIIRGKEGDDTLNGGSGDDLLEGGDGNDILNGGTGTDAMRGGAGDDMMNGGEGVDFVQYSGKRDAYTVTLVNKTTGEITVTGPDGTDTLRNVEQIVFDDVTIIVGRGTGQSDRIIGDLKKGSYFFQMLGISDDDAANLPTEDILLGGDGNDRLEGGRLDDYLDGSLGNDILVGGRGNDFLDGGGGSGSEDRAVFSGRRSDYSLTPDGRFLIVSGPDGRDTLDGIDILEFSNATVRAFFSRDLSSTEVNRGSDSGDIILGDDRDNNLDGGGGNDIFSGAAGNDTINGGLGRFDTVYFSGLAAESAVSVDGRDVIVAGPDGTDRLSNVERLAFSDVTYDLLIGTDGIDLLPDPLRDVVLNPLLPVPTATMPVFSFGLGGDDLLTGTTLDDVLEGGAGNDTLRGLGGTDTARFSARLEDVEIGLSGSAITVVGPDGSDRLISIERLVFADTELAVAKGSDANESFEGTIRVDVILAGGGADKLAGKAGDDILVGGAGDDKIVAGAGDDDVSGGADDDQLKGATGNDTLDGGDGEDNLFGGGGKDLLIGGDGRDSLNGGGGADELLGGVSRDLLLGRAGADNLDGGESADTLKGGGGGDVLMGGTGNDMLFGQGGKDTFVFDGTVDEGTDEIRDFDPTLERLQFVGIAADQITQTSEGASTRLVLASGTEILLFRVSEDQLSADNFEFV